MKVIKIGVLCWRPMVVGDSIIFASFINFFQDLNLITKPLGIEYKLVFFVHENNLSIPSLFYKKYIEDGLLKITSHSFGKCKNFSTYFKSFTLLVKQIRATKCDVFFNSRTNSQGFWFVCLLSEAKKISGLKNSITKNLITKKRKSNIHRVYQTVIDVKKVVLPFYKTNTDITKQIEKIEARKIELLPNLFTPHKFEKKAIGIFIGASGLDKVLHPSQMAKVIEFLHKNYKNTLDIALFGSGDMELNLFTELKQHLEKLNIPQDAYKNYINKTNLHQAIEHCGGLTIAITNDSGFMHVASLFNIPTISFFGYTPAVNFMTQVFNNSPFLGLQSNLPCSPCLSPGACPFKSEAPQHFRKCLTQNVEPFFLQIKNFVDKVLSS